MAKITVEKLQEKFKNANECISVQHSPFNMKDYDINNVYYDYRYGFFIKDNNGNNDKQLYDTRYKLYAVIIN